MAAQQLVDEIFLTSTCLLPESDAQTTYYLTAKNAHNITIESGLSADETLFQITEYVANYNIFPYKISSQMDVAPWWYKWIGWIVWIGYNV